MWHELIGILVQDLFKICQNFCLDLDRSFIKIETCLATHSDESNCTKGHTRGYTIQGYLVVASLCITHRVLSLVGAYTGQGTGT